MTYVDVCSIIKTSREKGGKRMRGESRKRKKPFSKFKAWIANLLKDLIVEIVASIIVKMIVGIITK